MPPHPTASVYQVAESSFSCTHGTVAIGVYSLVSGCGKEANPAIDTTLHQDGEAKRKRHIGRADSETDCYTIAEMPSAPVCDVYAPRTFVQGCSTRRRLRRASHPS
jgi:hypothetical protein